MADPRNLTVQELEPEPLAAGPEDTVSTTDRPVREEVRRTVAAMLARELSKRPTRAA